MADNFVEPSDQTGEWSDARRTWFWHDPNPFAAKHAVEKMTGILVERDADEALHLRYSGTTNHAGHARKLRLCFEAVIRGRNLYSLSLQSSAQRKWTTEKAFLASARRTFDFWCTKLSIPEADIAWNEHLPTLYAQRKSQALDAETAAALPAVDAATVAALQQEILAALRAGMMFFTAHKEGGTHLKFDDKAFIRSDYGEDPKLEVFPTDDAMLACLRAFFDWDSRRDVYPHRPPEHAVWQYIRSRLVK